MQTAQTETTAQVRLGRDKQKRVIKELQAKVIAVRGPVGLEIGRNISARGANACRMQTVHDRPCSFTDTRRIAKMSQDVDAGLLHGPRGDSGIKLNLPVLIQEALRLVLPDPLHEPLPAFCSPEAGRRRRLKLN